MGRTPRQTAFSNLGRDAEKTEVRLSLNSGETTIGGLSRVQRRLLLLETEDQAHWAILRLCLFLSELVPHRHQNLAVGVVTPSVSPATPEIVVTGVFDELFGAGHQ